ncbi:hypothetical protein Hanom_Chr08g00695001 [Helianthus anomalus]
MSVLAIEWVLSEETEYWKLARTMDSLPWLMAYKLQDLSLREGLAELPEDGISGRIRVPISVLGDKWWSKCRDGVDIAIMRSEGRITVLEFGVECNMKGDGSGGAGGAKLFKSSKKNREGGGNSVSTSSMSCLGYYQLKFTHERLINIRKLLIICFISLLKLTISKQTNTHTQ